MVPYGNILKCRVGALPQSLFGAGFGQRLGVCSKGTQKKLGVVALKLPIVDLVNTVFY